MLPVLRDWYCNSTIPGTDVQVNFFGCGWIYRIYAVFYTIQMIVYPFRENFIPETHRFNDEEFSLHLFFFILSKVLHRMRNQREDILSQS
jgi:hypothetical protein